MRIAPGTDSRDTRQRALRLLAATVAVVALASACGGGGDTPAPPPSGGNPPPPSPPPPPSGITVLGKATFDRVPNTAGGGLDYAATVEAPIRGATVELVDAGGATVATGTTDAEGNYSLNVASAALPITVRVMAEVKGSNHAFEVRDNTDGGALWGMASPALSPAAESTTTQNIHAPSGWGGSSYTTDRVAGPFSILDMAYLAKEKVLSAAPTVSLQTLGLYWSPNNVPAAGTLTDGGIGTSLFTRVPSNLASALGLPAGNPALFLLGAENTDTDEYDVGVVAHEIGHYLQYAVSRDDSIGGQHSGNDLLDMRVAFSEGWGNAWSSMVRNDPVYADSLGAQQSTGFDFSMATVPAVQGWYSEASVQYLLWQDYQDSAVGFGGIYAALTSLTTSPTFSSIFSFNQALRAARPAAAAAIDARAVSQDVNGTDAYGSGESNFGSIPAVVAVYGDHDVALGASKQYCLSADAGRPNKLGNHAFVAFTASGTRTITVTRSASIVQGTDPDIKLLTSAGQVSVYQGETANVETIAGIVLPAGRHVMAINDYALNSGTRCFDVRID